MNKISLDEKFALFSEYWRPKTIAALNGQEIKLVKVQGEFPWHHHEREDEFFMVSRGRFRVEFRDHVIALEAGEVTKPQRLASNSQLTSSATSSGLPTRPAGCCL
jgi:hypothetical protein